MYKYGIYLVSVALISVPLLALSPEEAKHLLQQTDQNRILTTYKYSAIMDIQKRVKRRKTLLIWGKGDNTTLMSFTNPGDVGTKFLRLDDQMWLFYPDAEELIKISGHLLKEGMMGSDISYEDMTQNEGFVDDYTLTYIADETLQNTRCHHLELIATSPKASYKKRHLWIDPKTKVILKMVLFSRSGKALRTFTFSDIKQIKKRYIATKIRIENALRTTHYTEIHFTEILIDIPIKKGFFSKKTLLR